MRVLLALLILPALAFAAPDKRFYSDFLTRFVDIDTLKGGIQTIVDVVGSDPTEQACIQTGHQLLKGVLVDAIPLICHGFQELVHHFNIVQATTTTTAKVYSD